MKAKMPKMPKGLELRALTVRSLSSVIGGFPDVSANGPCAPSANSLCELVCTYTFSLGWNCLSRTCPPPP